MINTIDTSTLLTQLRSMARDAGLPAVESTARDRFPKGVTTPDAVSSGIAASTATAGLERTHGSAEVVFTELLRNSLEGVDARSRDARVLTEAFERGSPDVELADVMIAVQKARVSFEALTQVRNKMMAAYQDIMSTPL